MRLVPHRLPASIVCPHMENTLVSSGSVNQVAATPTTWPAAAARPGQGLDAVVDLMRAEMSAGRPLALAEFATLNA